MLNTKVYNLLLGALDGSALKQTVISRNIANVNTPGYKKSVVDFRESLESILAAAEKEHLSAKNGSMALAQKPTQARVVTLQQVGGTSLKNDGNNVDIDLELAELAENNLYFNSMAQLLSSQLAMIKYAIGEGGR